MLKKYYDDFENEINEWGEYATFMDNTQTVCILDSLHEFSATLRIETDSTIINAENIIVKTTFATKYFSPFCTTVFVVSVDSYDLTKNYFWKGLPLNINYLQSAIPEVWHKNEFDLELPVKLSAEQKLSVYIWNPDKKKMYIDNFEVEILSVKKNIGK